MPLDAVRGTVRALRRDRVFAAILLVFLLITVAGAFLGPMRWDEGSFLHNAEVLLGEDTRLEHNRPIALSALIAAVWVVTDESVVAARLLVVLFGLGCIILFRRIAREEAGSMVVAAFAFAPLLLYWSFHIYTDVPALFFLLLGWWFYRERRPLAAGIAVAAATTFRFLFAVFGVAFVLAYLYERRDLIRFGAGSVLGGIPVLLHSGWRYGGALVKPRLYINRVGQWSDSGLLATPLHGATAGVLALAGLVPAVGFAWEQMDPLERSTAVLYPAFLLLYVGNPFTRYWLPLLPLLLLVARRGCSRTVFVVAAGSMLLLSGVSVGSVLLDEVQCEGPYEDAIRYVEENTTGSVVADRWAEAAFYLDRPVHSPWTTYEELAEDYNVTHAVTQGELPYRVEARFRNRCRSYTVYALK